MTDNSSNARHLLFTLHPLGKATTMTISHAQHLTQSQVTQQSGNSPDTTLALKAHESRFFKYQVIKRVVIATSVFALLMAAVATSSALRETKRTRSLLTEQSTAPVIAISPASLEALASAYRQNKIKGSIFPE